MSEAVSGTTIYQRIGGEAAISAAAMRDAHSRLAIEQRHFDSVAVHLVETLRGLGVPADIISEIAAAVTPLSSQIVNTHLGQLLLDDHRHVGHLL